MGRARSLPESQLSRLRPLCLPRPDRLRLEPAADPVIANGKSRNRWIPVIIRSGGRARGELIVRKRSTRYPKTANPIPGLAERWEISSDGRITLFLTWTNTVVRSTRRPHHRSRPCLFLAAHPGPGDGRRHGHPVYVKTPRVLTRKGSVIVRGTGSTRSMPGRCAWSWVAPTPLFISAPTLRSCRARLISERHGDRWLIFALAGQRRVSTGFLAAE